MMTWRWSVVVPFSYLALLEKLPLSPEQKIKARQYQPYVYRIVLPVLGGLCVYLVTLLALNLLVDERRIAEELQVYIESKTGRQWNHAQGVDVSFFPSPVIEIPRVQLSNDYRSTQGELLKAEKLVAEIGWGELFSDVPVPSVVHFQKATLLLETFDKKGDNWSELKGLFRDRDATDLEMRVLFTNSALSYHDGATGEVMNWTPFQAEIVLGDRVALDAKAMMNDALLKAKASCGMGLALYPEPLETECQIRYSEQEKGVEVPNQFSYEGAVKMDATKEWHFDGSISVSAGNIVPAMGRWIWNDPVFAAHEGAVPLEGEGSLQLSPLESNLALTSVASGATKGAVTLGYQHQGMQEGELLIDVALEQLDVQDATEIDADLLLFWLKKTNAQLAEKRSMEGQFSWKIDRLVSGDQEVARAIQSNGAWDGKVLDVSSLVAELGDGGELKAQGYIYGGANSLQTNLAYHVRGENFKELFAAAQVEPWKTGIEYAAPYQAAGQMILRNDALLLSKMNWKLGDMHVVGGVNYLFNRDEKQDAIEAGIAIKQMPLEAIIAAWQGETSLFDYPSKLGATSPYGVAWLETLPIRIEGQVALENFAEPYAKESKASFRLSAKPEALELSRLQAQFDDQRFSGSVLIKRTPDMNKPRIVSTMNVSEIDLNLWAPYFYADANQNHNVAESRWSNKHMSFRPLEHWVGEGDLRVNRFVMGAVELEKLRTKWRIQNNRLTFNDLSAQSYDGQVALSAHFTSGDIPAFGARMDIARMDIQQAAPRWLGVEKSLADGLLSVKGSIETSGISIESWMSNLRGGLNVSAANAKFRGANVKAVSDQVRQRPDIRRLASMVPSLYENGYFTFKNIEVNGTFAQGIFTVDRGVASSRASVAKVEGSFSVPTFLADLSIQAKLLALGRGAPNLIVRSKGEPANMSHRYDTSSIERYISSGR